jgi:hypothetical protein
MRPAAGLLCAVAVFAGCGSSDERTAGDLICGENAPATDAHVVVDPVPAGFAISPSGDAAVVAELTDIFKRQVGSRFAAADSLFLSHKGTDDKVTILLFATEHGVDAQKVVQGVDNEATKRGTTFEHLDIAGEPGVIGGSDADGWAATAASGNCDIVEFISPQEQLLRDVIAGLPKRP